jgi:hypothetical protein
MAKVSLVLAAVVDLAVAALLIAVSGFLFGSGPESLRASGGVELIYAAGIVACVAAPIAGFVLNGIGRPLPAQFVAWLPAVGALAALVLPAPY